MAERLMFLAGTAFGISGLCFLTALFLWFYLKVPRLIKELYTGKKRYRMHQRTWIFLEDTMIVHTKEDIWGDSYDERTEKENKAEYPGKRKKTYGINTGCGNVSGGASMRDDRSCE